MQKQILISQQLEIVIQQLEAIETLKSLVQADISQHPWKECVEPALSSAEIKAKSAITQLMKLDALSLQIKDTYEELLSLISDFPRIYSENIAAQGVKLSRGKPPWSRKTDGRRYDQKLRWKSSEIEVIKTAAAMINEEVSEFIRIAALERARTAISTAFSTDASTSEEQKKYGDGDE